jgi:TetR/AcrR family transcriptional repressor of nem operon
MSRYPEERKGQTRERILAASDRLLKERGGGDASIAEVMDSAGLTVGGFYAHFASKQALEQATLLYGIGASMDRLLAPLESIVDDRRWVHALIEAYLRQLDEPDLATACPLTLLLPEVARGGLAFQSAFSERTAALLDRVHHRFPEVAGLTSREVAIAVFASLVGAVALARTIPAPHARERVRHATETMLVAMLWPDGAPAG